MTAQCIDNMKTMNPQGNLQHAQEIVSTYPCVKIGQEPTSYLEYTWVVAPSQGGSSQKLQLIPIHLVA